MKNELNQARIRTFGGFIPVYQISIVDEEQKIWKGKPIVDVEARSQIKNREVFFSREYLPDTNELDKVYHEVHFEDEEILGVEFWLIPKEKLLFGYDEAPKEGIILPKPNTIPFPRGGRPNFR